MSRRRRADRAPNRAAGEVPAPPREGRRRSPRNRRPPAIPWREWKRPLLVALAVAAAAFLVHARTIACGFVFDDQVELARGPDAWQWSELPGYFTDGVSGWYRPLRMASHLADFRLLAYEPWAGHLSNCLLHALNAALAFLALRGLLRRIAGRELEWGAAAGALLFAVHPLQGSAVGWICGRSAVLSATFALGVIAVLAARGRLGTGRIVAAGCLFLAALMAWEGNVVVFGWAAMVLWLRREDVTRGQWLGVGGALAAAAVVYFAARHAALGSVAPPAEAARESLTARVLRFPTVGTATLGMILLPWSQSADYYFPFFDAVTDPWVLGSLAACAGLAAAGACWFRRPYPVGFGLLWLAVGLAPMMTLDRPFQDRYVYLPILGLCALFGSLADPAGGSRRLRRGAMAAAAGVLVLAAAVNFTRLGRWQDDFALFSASLDHPLASGRCWNNLGREYLLTVDPPDVERARECHETAIRIEPDLHTAWTNLGNVLMREGDYGKAVEMFEQSIAINDRHALTRYNYGLCLLRLNRPDEAAPHLQWAYSADQANYWALYGWAQALRSSNPADAEKLYRRFLIDTEGKAGYEAYRTRAREWLEQRAPSPNPSAD